MIKRNDKNIDLRKEKESAIYLLSFLLPFMLMVAMLIAKHVFPFGENCILRTDFYHQYLPFHVELQDKLKNLSSLFYSFKVGLGTNFITLMAYYLICPFNILLFVLSENIVLEYLTVTIALKIALSGLTMGYYLVKKYDTDSFAVLFFALFYAMSGYMCAYYWDVMWLDNIVLFPLLVHFFEDMYNGKKPYMYIIVLAVSILCNYYIGAITGIFFIFYFIFYSIIREIKIKDIAIKFLYTGIYTIIAILMSGILLLPIFMAFKTTASSDMEFPSIVREYFTIMEVVGRHLPFVKVENGIEYWPNLYPGSMCFGLFTLYLLSKKYKLKEKLCYVIFLLFFIASFSINILDFIWHVGKFPNSLPARQSFIYIFILLTVCIKPMLKINSIKVKDIVIAFAIPILLLILTEKSICNKNVGFYSVYGAIIFIFIYMGLFLLYKNKKYDKNILLYVVIVVVCFEAFMNMFETSISTIKRDDYMKNATNIRALTSGIKDITDDFYRVEKDVYKTKNDGAFLHYPSASIFSSSAYEHGTNFYRQFGMEASTNAYSMTGSTPFTDALMTVKYYIEEKENKHVKELNRRLIADDSLVYLYQNLDTLPFSYVLDDKILDDFDMSAGNPATVQNNFSRTMNHGAMLRKKDITIKGKVVNYKTEEAGNYYAFIRDKGIKEVVVTYPTTTKTYNNLNRGYFIELGYIDKDVDLEFRNDINDNELLMELFLFDYDVFKKVISDINDNFTYDMKKIEDSYILYDIDSKIDGTCIVSLPYDDGFTIYVDGEKVAKKETMELFLSFDIKKGKHTIELKYMPIGFIYGMLLTFCGIILLIGLYIIRERLIKKPEK